MVWRGDVMCTQIEGLQPSERRTFEQAIASAYGKDATRGDAYKLLQAGAASAKDGAHQEAIETFWTGLRMPKLPRDLKAKFEAGIKSSNDAIAQALQAKMEEEAVRKRQRLLNFNMQNDCLPRQAQDKRTRRSEH
jgi:hypothetical protein